MKTQFVPISGFEHYGVSSDGSIYNSRTERYIFGSVNAHGYRYVTLCDRGRKRKVCNHTVVAEAFVICRGKKCTQVDHINGDKTDNRHTNLQWATPRTNIRRAIRMGNHPASPLWQAKHNKRSPFRTTRYQRSKR